jgi:hypothetical protein
MVRARPARYSAFHYVDQHGLVHHQDVHSGAEKAIERFLGLCTPPVRCRWHLSHRLPVIFESSSRFREFPKDLSRVRQLLSSEHFSVEGTLIDVWAIMKSFAPKNRARQGGSALSHGHLMMEEPQWRRLAPSSGVRPSPGSLRRLHFGLKCFPPDAEDSLIGNPNVGSSPMNGFAPSYLAKSSSHNWNIAQGREQYTSAAQSSSSFGKTEFRREHQCHLQCQDQSAGILPSIQIVDTRHLTPCRRYSGSMAPEILRLVLPVRRYTPRPIHSFIAASSRVFERHRQPVTYWRKTPTSSAQLPAAAIWEP